MMTVYGNNRTQGDWARPGVVCGCVAGMGFTVPILRRLQPLGPWFFTGELTAHVLVPNHTAAARAWGKDQANSQSTHQGKTDKRVRVKILSPGILNSSLTPAKAGYSDTFHPELNPEPSTPCESKQGLCFSASDPSVAVATGHKHGEPRLQYYKQP